MYLSTATTQEEIFTYGIKPLIELMNILEDEILDDMDPNSRAHILWTEIKGKALMMREVSERINQAEAAKMKQTKDKTSLIDGKAELSN